MTLSVCIFDIVAEWLRIDITFGCPIGSHRVLLTETRRTSQRYTPCPVLETYVILIATGSRTLVGALIWSMWYRICNFRKRRTDLVLIWCWVIFFMIFIISSVSYVIRWSTLSDPKLDFIAIRTRPRWVLQASSLRSLMNHIVFLNLHSNLFLFSNSIRK